MKAILRRVRISPKKANLVAQLVRNMKATEAIDVLNFTPKKAAPIIRKVIQSAVANAENNFKQNPEDLYITEIIVNEGVTLKRSIPISRGRVHPLLKRTSHITVKVGLPSEKMKAEKEVKVEKPKKTEEAKKEDSKKDTKAKK